MSGDFPSVESLVRLVRTQCEVVDDVPANEAYDEAAPAARASLRRAAQGALPRSARAERARAVRDSVLARLAEQLNAEMVNGTSVGDVRALMEEAVHDIYAAFTLAGVLGAPRSYAR